MILTSLLLLYRSNVVETLALWLAIILLPVDMGLQKFCMLGFFAHLIWISLWNFHQIGKYSLISCCFIGQSSMKNSWVEKNKIHISIYIYILEFEAVGYCQVPWIQSNINNIFSTSIILCIISTDLLLSGYKFHAFDTHGVSKSHGNWNFTFEALKRWFSTTSKPYCLHLNY